MLQCPSTPTVPTSATQRGACAHVPRMLRMCGPNVSVSATGTTPPNDGSASDQCMLTR